MLLLSLVIEAKQMIHLEKKYLLDKWALTSTPAHYPHKHTTYIGAKSFCFPFPTPIKTYRLVREHNLLVNQSVFAPLVCLK